MIKFRAWDKENRKIRDILSLHTLTGMAELDNGKYTLYPDEIIVMQSTGLFDDTGQEIFEKDVVKRTSLAPGGVDCVGVVKMLEGTWIIDTGSDAVHLWTEIDEIEVVGNVYENRDLLEVSS